MQDLVRLITHRLVSSLEICDVIPLLHVLDRDNWASSLYHIDSNIILYVNIMLDIILSVEYLHMAYTTFRELAIPHI
jgi:hypothetical protein